VSVNNHYHHHDGKRKGIVITFFIGAHKIGRTGSAGALRPAVRHSNLGRAVALGMGNWREETLAYAQELARLWPADRSLEEWLAALTAFNEALGAANRKRSGTFRRPGS
jgi:hypothetical protein